MCEEETTPPLDMPINPIKVLSVTIFDPNDPPKDPNNDPKRMGRDGPSAALITAFFAAFLAAEGAEALDDHGKPGRCVFCLEGGLPQLAVVHAPDRQYF